MAQIETMGKTSRGTEVRRVSLRSESLQVSVLTLGAVLHSVRLAGVDYDLTLGSDKLADYEGAMGYYGSLIAPVVNRIAGAQAQVAGRAAQLEANFLGKHCLHSGTTGAQHQVWDIADHGDDHVTLALHLPDGLGGFAGARDVTARFSLRRDTLRLDVAVRSDAPTLWNAANHSYWNLDGMADYRGHVLRVAAGHYLPTNLEFIPTGEVVDVTGTPFDFRAGRVIAPSDPPLDNSFCLSNAQVALREVLMLRGNSGVTLRLSTTEAGVQLYDCRHDGYRGVAIEAQNWPDAPHHAGFPSIDLAAGVQRVQSTAWQFSKG
ncbi:MAG: aldose epimerase family protein [Cypionkella sp.]|nr:aldose epimerase family protein [Cypionkella sp.]